MHHPEGRCRGADVGRVGSRGQLLFDDDDTVAVIAAEAEEGPYALLRCELSGPCTTEASFADPDGLQLPVGSPIGD